MNDLKLAVQIMQSTKDLMSQPFDYRHRYATVVILSDQTQQIVSQHLQERVAIYILRIS